MAHPASDWTACFSSSGHKVLITGASKGIRTGIRIATRTRRFAGTVDVADAALLLASDASATVNGDLLMVEGGRTSV